MLRPFLKMTYDELRHLPEDGNTHELIDGEHIVTHAPSLRHQHIVVELVYQIRHFLNDHQIGRVYVAPVDLVLDEVNAVQPDLVFVPSDLLAIQPAHALTSVPPFVVEIVSPSSRQIDRLTKKTLYESSGVSEYWLIEPERKEVVVFLLTESGYSGTVYSGDIQIPVQSIPGLDIDCGSLFKP